MKSAILVPLAMLLATSTAAARWELDDASDGKGFLYIASQIDETDTIEVQVACDELLDGGLLLSVFTGIDPGKVKDSAPPVPVTVAFGTTEFADLTGKVVDIEGERILDIAEADEADVRAIATAIRKGKDMTVSYLDVSWTLTGEDAPSSLAGIFEHCP